VNRPLKGGEKSGEVCTNKEGKRATVAKNAEEQPKTTSQTTSGEF
jgi:hypothetical protein